jgi:hypothetical protein
MPNDDIGRLTADLDKQALDLASGGETRLFSDKGFVRLQEKVAVYITQLVRESINVAHRHRADVASPEHVDMADHYLVAYQSRRLYKACGTAGGVLLGAAASSILAMVLVNLYPPLALWLTVGFAALGGILTALHIQST